jgi:hypothetical protein
MFICLAMVYASGVLGMTAYTSPIEHWLSWRKSGTFDASLMRYRRSRSVNFAIVFLSAGLHRISNASSVLMPWRVIDVELKWKLRCP